MKRLVLVFSLMFPAWMAMGQVQVSDIELALKSHHKSESNSRYFLKLNGPPALYPVKIALGSLMYFYQSRISEQLPTDCPYSPSCSAFSKACIESHGLVKGMLLSADRLTRCIPSTRKDHPLWKRDPFNGRVADSPLDY